MRGFDFDISEVKKAEASEARSVLVESWVLEDAATEQLMKHFFKHLDSEGSANESLHHDRKKEKPTTMEKNEGDKEEMYLLLKGYMDRRQNYLFALV
ncbi:hypothetical protein pdam_00002845 [Pocillopora damicornis]|uniref:CHAT domain-containing protein n=1 Tax=Pocillopora damicornis TaxID=46731 RepID=A0A3M6U909_POCDA|nr:hypothetical protein pdam_00002845 [Pocillopora damicornis]